MSVIVYTKPECGPCKATIRKLTNNLVAHTVEQAADNTVILADLGYTSAPVVEVLDHEGEVIDHWSGYRPERLDALIAERG